MTNLAKLLRPGAAGEKTLERLVSSAQARRRSRLLAVLNKLETRKMTDETRVEYEKARTYLQTNAHRMDYPEYLRRGWQIGSGSWNRRARRW